MMLNDQVLRSSSGKSNFSDRQVLVASIGSGMQPKRMEIAARLWEAGIAVSPNNGIESRNSRLFLGWSAAQLALPSHHLGCLMHGMAA